MFRSEKSCWNYMESVCPVFDTGSWYFWLTVAGLFLLVYYDAVFIFRTWRDRIMTGLTRPAVPPKVLSTHVYNGVCLTSMDFSCSMACSATFLRECELAFRAFLNYSMLEKALSHFQATITNSSNNLKFRKPIFFLEFYSIQTAVVWWDEQSLYIQQKMVRSDDRTICAVNYSRQIVNGAKPQELLDYLPGCSCLPHIPPDIASWVVCIRTVNRQLTLSGHC